MKFPEEKKPVVRTPFPYFGSKRKVAVQIWERFGEPKAYIEPFAGSLSVLLGRPKHSEIVYETVNDADGLLINFWRAVSADSEAVARHADYPISASDLTARHAWLLKEAGELQKRLLADGNYFDAKLAGLWAWGMSSARKFCVEGKRPTPRSGENGLGLHRCGEQLPDYFRSLQNRLRNVVIHAGDWRRVLRRSYFARRNAITAVFLDPPYSKESGRSKTKLYRVDDYRVAKDAAAWAIEHGDSPSFRIAFCGLAGEHDFPNTWEEFSWQNDGGRHRTRDWERIWFSPYCLCPGTAPSEPKPKLSPRKARDNCVSIDKIQIGDRHRKDIGDLEAFAENIREYGLLQPIGISPDMRLVFGERRLRACRDVLGWTSIPARTINVQSIAHGEFAENEMRKQYTPSERYAIVETLRGFEHGGDRRSTQDRNCDDERLTTSEVSKLVGFSRDDAFRVKKVVENGVPELVVAMDSGQLSISAAAKLSEACAEDQRAVLAKPNNEERWTAARIEKQLHRVRKTKQVAEAEAKTVVEAQATDQVRIYHCVFQSLEERSGLAPNSASLICTDFPFTDEFVSQIDDLAALAERVLMPGGTFVSYVGQHRLPEKIATLDKHLTYRWLCPAVWTGVGNSLWHLNLISKSQMIAVYSKGDWSPVQRWVDLFLTNHPEKHWHEWQRPQPEVERLISYFSNPGDLVVDPCGGGFTTAIACERLGRKCISCDMEKSCVVRGQERLAKERASPQPASDLLPIELPSWTMTQESRLPPEMAG